MRKATPRRSFSIYSKPSALETMTDVFSKKQRSQVMAAIRSKGNKTTELRLASILRAHGIKGWRRDQPLFGKPDFVFRRERLAVFVDGCFWHGYSAQLGRLSIRSEVGRLEKAASHHALCSRFHRLAAMSVHRVHRVHLVQRNSNCIVKSTLPNPIKSHQIRSSAEPSPAQPIKVNKGG